MRSDKNKTSFFYVSNPKMFYMSRFGSPKKKKVTMRYQDHEIYLLPQQIKKRVAHLIFYPLSLKRNINCIKITTTPSIKPEHTSFRSQKDEGNYPCAYPMKRNVCLILLNMNIFKKQVGRNSKIE